MPHQFYFRRPLQSLYLPAFLSLPLDAKFKAKFKCSKYNDLLMASVGGYCYGVFVRGLPVNGAAEVYELAMGTVGFHYSDLLYDAPFTLQL